MFENDKSSFALFETTRDLTMWEVCVRLVGGGYDCYMAKKSSGSSGKDKSNWYVLCRTKEREKWKFP